jgi:hypothetical protein
VGEIDGESEKVDNFSYLAPLAVLKKAFAAAVTGVSSPPPLT